MIEELKRSSLALAGGMTGAVVVAAVEARAALAQTSGTFTPTLPQLFFADMSVLAPLAVMLSLAVATAHLYLEPGAPRSPGEHLARVRAEPVLVRSRTAALWPLGVLAFFAWTVSSAHLARAALAQGRPLSSGFELAVDSVALLAALGAVGLAALPPVRRLLASGAPMAGRLLDPPTTGGVALALAVGLFAAGVALGDTGGDGAWPLGIFGVMKRRELDLRPVANLLVIAAGAYFAAVAFAARRGALAPVLSLAVALVPLVSTFVEARALGDAPHVARAVERYAPLGRIALAAARAATDRDRDGASGLFAGGDCDDKNPKIHPSAVDVPGNGVDEDCSGADAVLPVAPPSPPPPAQPKETMPEDLNLIVITIDTLRTDVGFMGYAKDTTPNLDRLATRSVVFDRAYAMASYTGKSLAPMFIGLYPNETVRDGGHFNTYAPANVFTAERLKDAGVVTMGAASHWYFNRWSGLPQGIDTWDLSAKPGEGQGDTDTSVTSKELADAAIRLLSKSESTRKRFFMWVHFFDPHAQYSPHAGAPDFLGDERGPTALAKAAYDGEVWFTDKHVGRVLDHIADQPWAARTAIVVTADHGEAFNEHGMSFHGIELWESLVHVPLLVFVPGVPPHHVPVKRGHIDVAPTLLALMRVPAEGARLRGVSLVPDLLATDEGEYVERDVYFDMPAGPYNLMRRGLLTGTTPGKKLIHFGANQYQLFDLATDPGEKDDLSPDPSALAPAQAAFQALRGGLEEIEVKPESANLP